MSLLATAQAYRAADLSVIPCYRAEKKPALPGWKQYQTTRPTFLEVAQWFMPWERADAVAIIGGAVSGQLEVIDFDLPELFPQWQAQVQAAYPDLALPVVRTQSGGYHVYLRCPTRQGNLKLACDPAKPIGKYTLIETKSEGGYVLAPPSAGYTMLSGDLTAVPTVTPEQRETLLHLAQSYDRRPAVTARAPRPATPTAGDRPGDVYNQRGDVYAVLLHHGWKLVKEVAAESYWRRPGKHFGHGATFNYRGCNLFYVFTSNAPPFEPEQAYSRFAVYALLNYGGDYAAAARALRAEGFTA
ncbi:MAG TPA: bifunctional DNA primase/polymerase [Anaerolineae bacterium]|nr:bifunctional DNA primase/polymerase [Anaerolineae bacterium]